MDSFCGSIVAALLFLSLLPSVAIAGPPEAAAAAAAAADADEAENALAPARRARAPVPAHASPQPPSPPDIVPPEPDSLRARALDALAGAQELTLYSLQPWQYPRTPAAWDELSDTERSRREAALVERSESRWCKRETCFYRNRVLGRTRVVRADAAVVRTALGEALGRVPDYVSLCAPEYRHAVSFVSGGRRFEVLLCYQCGQILVVENGEQASGQAASMGDLRALNAILRRAGIALAKIPVYAEE